MTNSIRPVVVASLLGSGEAQDAVVPDGMWTVERPYRAVSLGEKPDQTPGTAAGGWRQNDRKFQHSKQGDLNGQDGVHATTAERPSGAEEPPFRSQSVRSSEEAG